MKKPILLISVMFLSMFKISSQNSGVLVNNDMWHKMMSEMEDNIFHPKAAESFTVRVDNQVQTWHKISVANEYMTMQHIDFMSWLKVSPANFKLSATNNLRFFKEANLRPRFKSYEQRAYVKKRD